MNKFLVVLKKELREIISVQLLIPVVLIFALFYFMGDFMDTLSSDTQIEVSATDIELINSGEEYTNSGEDISPTGVLTISTRSIIGLIDNDNSELSRYVVSGLRQYGMTIVTPSSNDPAAACEELLNYEINGNQIEVKVLAVINKGFEENLTGTENIYSHVDVYSTINTLGALSVTPTAAANITNFINSIVSQKLYEHHLPDADMMLVSAIQRPVYEISHTFMNGETAQIHSGAIIGYIFSNTLFIPAIVFLIIVYSMQTLGTSVVNEKADKTLETLMTTPVNRMAVLFAKVLSAAIYASIYAVIYVIGLRNYMDSGTYSPEVLDIIEKFGISFNFITFAVIGIQLFLSVLCGLGMALILGIMVEDIKTLQAYIMPIMLLIMVPYLVSIVTDINTLPLLFRFIIYVIPFTHTFAAAANIFTQNYILLIGGIIYQIVFVIAMLAIAIKIFNSDKLITLSEIIKSRSAKKKQGIKLK